MLSQLTVYHRGLEISELSLLGIALVLFLTESLLGGSDTWYSVA